MVEITLKTNNYEIKKIGKVKTSARIGIPNKFINKTIVIIPLINDFKIKENTITINTTYIKEVFIEKKDTRIYLPIEYDELNCIIAEVID